MNPVFELVRASVHFGRHLHPVRALSEVSLTIHTGERVALVGANGCGKSTLLRVLHGLAPVTAGQASCDPLARQAMVFQRPHLLRMPVQTNIALGLWLRGQSWAQAKAAALGALERVGLTELALRNACKLSVGQQQRVAMARACALDPQVLLLDEPTASLDPHAKREVEALMHEFASSGAAPTLVFASHNLGQVKRLASRVIYLEHGQVLADLPVADFFDGALLAQRFAAAHLFVKGELV